MTLLSLNSAELAFLDFIQEHFRCDFLDWFMPYFTRLADSGILWILITICLLLWPKYRRTGTEMAASLIICLLLGNLILKPWIGRIRPYDLNTLVHLIAAPPSDFSFPSGHTYSSFAAATVLLLNHKRWGILALVVSILIAFSRLYLYFHYPTDVLAGAFMGILAGFLSHRCLQNVWQRRAKREN